MSLFAEMKRRNVFRVGIAYVVVAWLILQVADVILNNIEAPGWVFESILLVLVIGLPVILLFAWAFELTPEGLKREKDVDRSESITPQTGKKLDRVIIGVLALALAYFVYDKFSPGDQRAAPEAAPATTAQAGAVTGPAQSEKSIAVLPLANRSNREEDQFFTDGMHDDLLTQLAKVSALKVISRTSVMRYRNTELPIPEIAAQLGVSTILEGGIQRAGDQVRINVQLIDAATDEHLWAETYDRQLTAENLFAIQSEITRQIIDALKATLTPDEAVRIAVRPTDNLEALEEYMRGQQEMAGRTVEGLNEAKAHFERAVELDPGFAHAVAALANAYHLLYEYAGLPEEESLDPAMALLEQALELSPELGEAYMVRGEIHRHRDQLEASEADFLKAGELLPGNATVWHWFSFLRSDQGRTDDYYELLERAHQLDPMSAVIHANWAMRPFHEGRDEETLAELQRVKSLHPAYPFTFSMESWIYFNQGRPVEELRAELEILELDPGSTRTGDHCFTYLTLDARETARRCVQDYAGPRSRFRLFAGLETALVDGDTETARALLDSEDGQQAGRWFQAYGALMLRDFDRALPMFEEAFAAWFDDGAPVELDPKNPRRDAALNVALVLQKSGREQRAHQVLDALLASMEGAARNRGARAYGFADVEAYALLGETERALQALEECIELRYLSGWQGLRFKPHVDSLRGDPRFDSALARLSEIAAEERSRAESEGLL